MILSILWTLVWFFYRTHLRHYKQTDGFVVMIPSLAIATVIIVSIYQLFAVNLVFSVHFLTTFEQTAIKAIVPALVLNTASGLFSSISYFVDQQVNHWRTKAFYTFGLAIGKSERSILQKLVILRALFSSWVKSLPLLFSELIIVEVLFNAPGLGLEAWHYAKTRNISNLIDTLSSIILIYAICVFTFTTLNGWLGKKLESY